MPEDLAAATKKAIEEHIKATFPQTTQPQEAESGAEEPIQLEQKTCQ